MPSTVDLTIDKVEGRPNSRHLNCSYLECPHRTDNTRRSKAGACRSVGCINDTEVDSDYLALSKPDCQLAEENGKRWVNRVNWYQMRI